MYQNLGLNWEDAITDDDGHVWARICKKCVEKYNIPDSLLEYFPLESLCDVEGCQNEMDFYIDFKED